MFGLSSGCLDTPFRGRCLVMGFDSPQSCRQDVAYIFSGGYSGGVPPLPIPNRAVKPARADGTAMQCGRVGRRLLLFVVPRAFPIDGKGAGDEFLWLLVK